MRALCWHGTKDVRIDNVAEPKLLNPHDAIIKIKATTVCGSDLHIYDGHVMSMKKGDIIGHEFAGEVVDIGKEVKSVKIGDRVVIPFTISCGKCYFCIEGMYSACDNSNPNGALLTRMTGYPGAALFGYSHLYGGMPGGQAEYVRVPFADVGALKIPDSLDYDQVLFLSDIFPTGYMAAENCGIKRSDTVAVWGAGPVGQFAAKSALMLGASRVIMIDRFQYRLDLAKQAMGAEIINYEKVDVHEALLDLTEGMGPDACIDAVGAEAHGTTLDALYDEAAQKTKLEFDRTHALRQAIGSCRKGGVVSIPGVYFGFVDRFPLGIAFAKGLTFKMGQTHMQRYMKPLLERIENGDIDPRFVISHRLNLNDTPAYYKTFCNKEDNSMKVILTP